MTRVAIPGVPDLKVEFAPTDDASTTSPTWVDITSYVRMSAGVSFERGRNDERATAQPGQMTLTLNNTSGRFTPNLATGAYHPLRIRCPIRVSFKPPGAGAYTVMWTGLVDQWSPDWSGGRATCRVQASDRLAVLQRQTLQAWETHQHLFTGATLLWPFTEDAGATTVGETATGTTQNTLTLTAVGSSGSGEVGVGALPIDSGTVAAFTPTDASNGYNFTGTTSIAATPVASSAVSVLMNATTNPAATSYMLTLASANNYRLDVGVTTTGRAYVRLLDPGSLVLATVTGTSTITTGDWQQVGATLSASGSAWSLKLYVNGTQESSTATTTTDQNLPALGATATVGGTVGAMYSGQLSHACYWSAPATLALTMTEARKAITGAVGETSTARHERICDFAGVTSGTVGTGLSTLGPQPIRGRSVLEALGDVADAELSPLYATPAGVPTLASRDERYNAAVALSVTRHDIATNVEFVVNDQNLINDVRGSRPGGPELRHTAASSVSRYGTKSDTVQLILQDDTQLAAVVEWNATTTSEPAPRTSRLEIDAWVKQATVTLTDCLALTIGSRVQVTSLPAEAPAATLDLFTEGMSDVFNTGGWTRTLNTSAVGQSGAVWQLDDATYSVLDSTTILAV